MALGTNGAWVGETIPNLTLSWSGQRNCDVGAGAAVIGWVVGMAHRSGRGVNRGLRADDKNLSSLSESPET
eukprot:6328685-Lingulodinium_polyedra.AAC.1